MSSANSQKSQNWRSRQILLLGRDVFNKQQATARTARRHAKKPPKVKQPKIEEEPKPPISIFKRERYNQLITKIYNIKLKRLLKGKSIKRETVKQNLTRVFNIYKYMNGSELVIFNFDWLKDKNDVIKFITARYNTLKSQNNQITAIASILETMPKYANLYKSYFKLGVDNNKKIKDERGDNLLNDKDKVNIPLWSDILAILPKITDKRDKAIISIYVLIPPRRLDYRLLKLGIENNNEFNYYKNEHLIFNKYKTAKFFKQQIFQIPNSLKKILDDYIESANLEEGDFIFGRSGIKPYLNFGQHITKIFKKYNLKISVNSLRHSFISDFLKIPRSVNEKKRIADRMAHSINEQAFYFKFGL
jgi:hypothetical protein